MWKLPGGDCVALIVLPLLIAGGDAAAAAESQQEAAIEESDDAGDAAYAAGRFVDALRIWRPRAERGDPRAAFGLGLLYDIGQGVGEDAAVAFNWYRRAAEAGNMLAEFNVAVMLDSGTGTTRNPSEAALWYGRAAALGYARAEYNLAQLYQTGSGTPRNLEMAETWYAAAAAHGLSAAQGKLTSLREAKGRSQGLSTATKPTLAPAVPAGPLVAPASANGADVEVELCWSAPAEPSPVDYFVQVLALDAAGAHPAFATFSKRSALVVTLPRGPRDYAWRVYTVASASSPDYVPSAWGSFTTP